ncbi:unknown [Clostridium sp. CAG:813]|nr:unknown [Clostridium sp. CAG:813]
MEGLNKFKVLTIAFICMFVFVVAAIYSNTKDATMKKEKQKAEQMANREGDNISVDNAQLEELYIKVNELNKSVEELNLQKSGNNVNCEIRGIMGDNGLEELTIDAALQEARDNGRELVMGCHF